MLDLDKIRARLDRDAVCHCGELIRHHSQLSGHTAVEMTDPSHEETHALLDEIERLRSEFAAAQPVVEWRTVYLDGEKWHAAQPLEVCLLVGPNGWQMWMSVWAWVMKLNPMDSGPETGPVGKAACEAAYRRACGLPAIPACAG